MRNDSAYPTGDHRDVEPNYGISKREYFAGLAMQGLIANAPNGHLGNYVEGSELAVKWADALMNQLSK